MPECPTLTRPQIGDGGIRPCPPVKRGSRVLEHGYNGVCTVLEHSANTVQPTLEDMPPFPWEEEGHPLNVLFDNGLCDFNPADDPCDYMWHATDAISAEEDL